MLAAAGPIFVLFFLCSVYLQNVLGTSPLMTGLAIVPLAVSAGVGAHVASHAISRHGVRMPLAGAFGVAAVGMALLSRVRHESGMLSGLNSTGHEIGGTIGIAVFSTIAAGATSGIAGPSAVDGIGHAFLAGGIVTSLGSITALAVLPHARHFLPKLRLNPAAMPVH